jgi:hypothetical protein
MTIEILPLEQGHLEDAAALVPHQGDYDIKG